MDDLCTTCLCTGRNLYFIGETGLYELYSQILNEIPAYEVMGLRARVCWECRATLRRLRTFRGVVQAARDTLLAYLRNTNTKLPQARPSHLQIDHVINFSYPDCDVKSEFDVRYVLGPDGDSGFGADALGPSVKIEADYTHCEPETFVNDLNVEKVEKARKSEKKLKVKAKKEKKKKSKVKNKIKVKEKPKTISDEVLSLDNANDHGADSDADYCDDYQRTEENAAEKKEDCRYEEGGEELALPTVLDADIETQNVEDRPRKLKGETVKRPRASGKEVLDERPKCVECGKTFSSRKTYRYHLNVLHKGQNRYPCPRCGKVYQWKSNLGRHLRSHKARDTGELYCALCDKRFASVATYRQHQRVSRRHVAESEFAFICECGKKFVNKTRLRDHIDWEHLNKIKFRCQLCNKPFKCHTSLYVHTQNVHRDKEKKDNLCHVCGKSYQNSAKLKYHIVAMHTGETPYSCAECPAAFGWYSSLYRHVREVHYKMKLQSNKKGRKSKKVPNEVLPSLLPPQQLVLPPLHPSLPP